MTRIIWKDVIKSEKEFPKGELPDNAIQAHEPGNQYCLCVLLQGWFLHIQTILTYTILF